MMIWKRCLSLLIALSLLALLDALRPHRAIIISSSSGTSINAARSTTRQNLTLDKYLQELNDSSVGRVRFVVIGAGSILEAVGSFSNLRYSQTPRGKLATISTDEAFECHFKIDAIASVKHAKVDKFGKVLRIIRFGGSGDDKDTTYLSAILHESSEQEVRVFEGLRERYGDNIVFEKS